MIGNMPRQRAARSRPWDALLSTCARLRFEPQDSVVPPADEIGGSTDAEFAFAIKLLHYISHAHARRPVWHDQLELFLPIDGRVRFHTAHQEIELAPGDLLVIDVLKQHHVVDISE